MEDNERPGLGGWGAAVWVWIRDSLRKLGVIFKLISLKLMGDC